MLRGRDRFRCQVCPRFVVIAGLCARCAAVEAQRKSCRKVCVKCEQELPFELFGPRLKSPDGLQPRCRGCRRADHKAWRDANREHVRDYNRAKNADPSGNRRMREVARKWYASNRGRVSEQRQARRPTRVKALRAHNTAHYVKNREAILAKNKARYHANLEAQRARTRAYHARNPERATHRARLRRDRKRGVGGRVTIAELRHLQARARGMCVYCGTARATCFDHFVPVVKGGETTAANLVPSCKSCNCSKWAHNPERWVVKTFGLVGLASALSFLAGDAEWQSDAA
jgi:hypothetical protein